MNRIAPLTAFALCSVMLAGCATPDKSADARKAAADTALSEMDKTPTDLESGVRQAQLLRLAGKYDDAIHVLSQLMLVASDDPRVVGEYGKTLAQQGRAAEAVQFLGRAAELSSNDWTVYSALGVAYDQTGNTTAAKDAYEHALALQPDEPIVLNNYALSRMLANDPESARQLMERAQIAGGAKDPKIASNIAMINSLAPAPAAPTGLAYAVKKPAPAEPSATAIASAAAATTDAQITEARPFVSATAAPLGAPRPLSPIVATPGPVAENATPTVIMQKVPVDPLAGPVRGSANAGRVHVKAAAKKAPHPLSVAPEAINVGPTDAQKAAEDETAKKPVVAKAVTIAKKGASAKPTKAQQDATNAAEAVVATAEQGAAKKPAGNAPAKALVQNTPKKTAPKKDGAPSLRLVAD